MNECNFQRKTDKRNRITYDTKPDYERVKEEHLIEILKVIVQLPTVDLGAQFPDRGIPCYCPFHSNFGHLLRKQSCDDFFSGIQLQMCNDGNKGLYKTFDGFKNHCMNSEDFHHTCLGHFLVSLYNPQPERLFYFNQVSIQNKGVELENNNNGEGVSRMPYHLSR